MSQGPAQTTSLAEIKKANASLPPDTQASFFTVGGFDLMQRGAHLLASSTLVPSAYRNEIEDKKTGMLVKNPNAMSRSEEQLSGALFICLRRTYLKYCALKSRV